MGSNDTSSPGFGITFPFNLDKDGHIKMNSYEEETRQSVLLILKTVKGERVMRPDFGTALTDYVFSSLNSATMLLVKKEIHDALTEYEPRINVLNIDVAADSKSEGTMLVNLKYSIINTGDTDNLQFPIAANGGEA